MLDGRDLLWFGAVVFGLYGVMVLYTSRRIAETGTITATEWWVKLQVMGTSLVGYKSGGTVSGLAGLERPALLRPLFVGQYVAAGFWLIVGALDGISRVNVMELRELSF